LLVVFPPQDAPVLALIRAIKAGQAPDAGALTEQARALMEQGNDHVLVRLHRVAVVRARPASRYRMVGQP